MDGIIVVNKPKGYTSRDVVNIIGKALKTKKVGHTGTLDPLATGVLVVCIGTSLKVCELITAYDKEYIAEVELGTVTDTFDITGKVLYECDSTKVLRSDIEKSLNNFKGPIKQSVPMYSAVKVNGKKLYEYARKGESVDVPVKDVNIYDISLIGDIKYVNNKVHFTFKVKVSKGTYIRSLISDIGKDLGVGACMVNLERTMQGKFSTYCSNTISDIENSNYKLLSIEDVLDIPHIVVDNELLFKIKNGQKIENIYDVDSVLFLDEHSKSVAIYKKDDDESYLRMWKYLYKIDENDI